MPPGHRRARHAHRSVPQRASQRSSRRTCCELSVGSDTIVVNRQDEGDRVKITPSARVLKMLGEIEIAEWQCVAELVDNAFDDFNEIHAEGVPWAGGLKVSVALPKGSTSSRDAEVVVQDSGRGMTRVRLEQAVRAGWSGNDQFTKLGLFGMGFNVSTARLGRRTRVLTTQAGDTEWIGVEIDLDEIGDDFEAPDITEPKADPSEHGTRIEISKLDRNRLDWLARNSQSLRRQLGKVYGWLLDHRPFELWVGGIKVKPRRPCRWGDNRVVSYGSASRGEVIPAYISIDQTYAPAETCLNCGNWQEVGLGRCQECGETSHLRARERRIHGWVGIQRYLDHSEFGVDFLRNGRKILMNDKSIFEWTNIDDPTSPTVIEYPTELRQGGRIIGEIHLDHVPVDYKKDSFERSDRQWRQAISFLRGAGPMLPETAEKAGYPRTNDSPIGRLHRGFRRTEAGKRCLIPGDGEKALHAKAVEWAQKFYGGDPKYQSDEVWWQAVLDHEERKAGARTAKAGSVVAGAADEATVLDALGLSPTIDVDQSAPVAIGAVEAVVEPPVDLQRETEQERLSRYRESGKPLTALSGDLGHPDVGFFKVDALVVIGGSVLNSHGRPTPAWIAPGPGGTATAVLDQQHELFTRFGWSYEDAVVVELAGILKARTDAKLSVAEIASLIKSASLRDSAIDRRTVASHAMDILGEVRRRMSDRVRTDPERAFQWLNPDEVTAAENAMIADGHRVSGALGSDADFVLYAPALYLVRLLEEWPEAFLDGKVFVATYDGLASIPARRHSLSRVTSLLSDVASASYQNDPGPLRLQRTRLSVLLLAEELAPEE
jgi:hypothetical protein